MAVYRPDPGCCSGCNADNADPDPAVVDLEGLNFDWDSDHTHDY